MRRILSIFVLVTVFFKYTTLDLQAAELQTPIAPHSVSSQEMYQAIQASDQQMSAIRQSVQDFFARPEISAQIQRIGVAPERISSHVAMLSDSELQRLNQQIMAMDLRKETAGLSTGAIVAIVLAACAGAAIIIWLLWEATEELYDENNW